MRTNRCCLLQKPNSTLVQTANDGALRIRAGVASADTENTFNSSLVDGRPNILFNIYVPNCGPSGITASHYCYQLFLHLPNCANVTDICRDVHYYHPIQFAYLKRVLKFAGLSRCFREAFPCRQKELTNNTVVTFVGPLLGIVCRIKF